MLILGPSELVLFIQPLFTVAISIENVEHKYTICLHGGWENV